MHVLMLGWEFPPFITGGLGTACFGLTKALDAHGVKVTFVLPQSAGEDAEHVTLVSPGSESEPDDAAPDDLDLDLPIERPPTASVAQELREDARMPGNVEAIRVPAGFVSPYQTIAGDQPVGASQTPPHDWSRPPAHEPVRQDQPGGTATTPAGGSAPAGGSQPADPGHYEGDLVDQVNRYARFCAKAARDLDFDIIHAHDWMTYPAGLLLARLTGKPLVVHIHSTEFDRSGEHINQRIYDIERRGMQGALRVIAVSQLTRNVVIRRYDLPPDRVKVVYNGVQLEPREVGISGIEGGDKIVLYFGRITYQKGPEYFIAAANRVLQYMDNVKFVVAGSGDQATRMIEMAAELGIGHKVLFTGFLRGRHIQKVFALADLYVMPSISEPFGIAPLEAMGADVPVLISKSSGVSEVLTHALKVDFWDTEDMANKIIAVLRHPPLSQTLRDHGAFEVRTLTWDGAATKCERIYRDVIQDMSPNAAPAIA